MACQAEVIITSYRHGDVLRLSYPLACMVSNTGQGSESYRCHLELLADYGRCKAMRCEVCSKGGRQVGR